MRRPFVAGNWKMNLTLGEARALMRALKPQLPDSPPLDLAVCPPFLLLFPMGKELDGTTIRLGAQDVYCEASGAFTGEVSPAMLVDARCTYAIVGHSERRHVIGETGDLLARKTRAALAAGLEVIYCIGETLGQREAGQTEDVLRTQLDEVLGPDLDLARVVIAYEPVWAIGTGKNATAEQAQSAHRFIRDRLAKMYNSKVAEGVRLQYGGSVKPSNAGELMALPDVDGALVGGASLKADDFAGIIHATIEAKRL